MKQFKILLTVVLLTIIGVVSADAQTKKLKKNQEEITYKVLLHCESCKKKIEAALPYVKGVKDMKIDLKEQTIWLVYDKKQTTKEKLAEELNKLGYPAKEVVKQKENK